MLIFFKAIKNYQKNKKQLFKYAAYAAGETVLIVLGIIIAFGIDRNQMSKESISREKFVLNEIRKNLIVDKEELKNNIKRTTVYLNCNQEVLSLIKNRHPIKVEDERCFANLCSYMIFQYNSGAYEDLKSYGTNLIRNDSLRYAITELYLTSYSHINDIENNTDRSFQYNRFEPLILKNIETIEMWKKAIPYDVNLIYENDLFIETLKKNISLKKFMNFRYGDTIKRIDGIIFQIDEYIEKFK